MSQRYPNWRPLWMCAAIVLFVAACAKDEVAPIDVERQAFEDLKTQLREAIDDPTREAEAIRIVGALEQDIAALRNTVQARRDRVTELNANYDTPRAEFEAFLAGIEREVEENKKRVSESHRALLAAVNEEERAIVRRSHTAAMNAAIKTLQAI